MFKGKLIRIAAVIAPQYVSLFIRVPPCKIKKNLETLFIDVKGSPDQGHYVSIKTLEIPLLLVFFGEVDTYCGVDTYCVAYERFFIRLFGFTIFMSNFY